MFTEEQEKSIRKKVALLLPLKEGWRTAADLAAVLTRKREAWAWHNLEDIMTRYRDMSPEERAFNAILFRDMQVDPGHVEMRRVSDTRIEFYSRNFCPYLEACQRLGLDTRRVCREIGEPSIQAACRIIDPHLKFSRDYDSIRPYCDHCREAIEHLAPQ